MDIFLNKTVTDLMNKNEELENRENERVHVKITGPNGTPIYYQGSLKDDGYNLRFEEKNIWAVDLKSSTDDDNIDAGSSIPFNSTEVLEFRLAGNVLYQPNMKRLRVVSILDGFDEEHQMGWVSIENSFTYQIAYFIAKIGPLPFSTKQEYLTHGAPFLDAYIEDGQDQDMNMIITKVFFRKHEISGSMSLLQDLGVNTARKTPSTSTITVVAVTAASATFAASIAAARAAEPDEN